MKEYIERTDVLNLLEKINPVDFGSMLDYSAHGAVRECLRDVRYGVEDIPAADVVEVRHGRWIGSEMNFGYCDIIQKEYIAKKYICSECGYETGDQAKKFVCCPICMARMDKEDEIYG